MLAAAVPGQAAAADSTRAPEAMVASLLQLRELDARVMGIGHRLAVAGADLCSPAAALTGIAVHDLSQYAGRYRPAAAAAFGLDQLPGVLAVAAGSAAERAGVKADDVLVAIDGKPAGAVGVAGRHGEFEKVERVLDLIDEAVADGAAQLRLQRGGKEIVLPLKAEQGCGSRFQTRPSRELNAKADGRYVQVTTALAEYANGDAELAAVLAHELAHNILRHRARLDAAGISRGLLEQFGRNARLTRRTEIEADHLSIYLLDRAGYDPGAAARFWARYGRQHSGGIFAAATHPRWQQRVAALEEEVRRLEQLKREAPKPVPALLSAPLPTLE